MKSIAFAAAVLLATANALSPNHVIHRRATPTNFGVQEPSSPPRKGVVTVQGCFKSKGDMVLQDPFPYNSKDSCAQNHCRNDLNHTVAATAAGSECYCGDKYPPLSAKVDDKYCDYPCDGFGEQACGSLEYWTVYNTGLELRIDNLPSSKETKTSDSTTAGKTPTPTPSTPSSAQSSAVIPDEDKEEKKGGSNTAGIAAGVVVGVVVLVAAGVGIFFYLKRKKNREIEEEHRRNAAVNSFMGKPPSSSGMSTNDSRLDPVMAHRRMSDGSIADNQDYSRKILRVTNA